MRKSAATVSVRPARSAARHVPHADLGPDFPPLAEETGPPGRARVLLCSLLLAMAANAAGGPWAQGYPPLPDLPERAPRNIAEKEAGAVVLEAVVEIRGELRQEVGGPEGTVWRTYRYRYLALDSSGAEKLTRHAFLDEESEETATEISGRTVSAGGEELRLDPEKDVRNLDTRDHRGKTTRSRRTVFFPRVAPGAILDLSWRTVSKRLPGLEMVRLQAEFPVRRVQITVQGRLQQGKTVVVPLLFSYFRAGVYWAPFFLGPVPPRARGSLDRDFNLALEAVDLAPLTPEQYMPPPYRMGFTLGLMPRALGAGKEVDLQIWRQHRVVLGLPGAAPLPGRSSGGSRDLDPGIGAIRLDELGLQVPPKSWSSENLLMRVLQGSLKKLNEDLVKFLRTKRGRDLLEEVASVAPADLPWKERARRLFDHVRSNIEIEPDGDGHRSPSRLRKDGRGTPLDLTVYLAHLLKIAGIPSRVILAVSRSSIPFQPILGTWEPFKRVWLVRAGGRKEPPVYLMPGGRYAGFGTLPSEFLGALMFTQPDQEKADWPLGWIPPDLPVSERTEVELEASLEPGGEEVLLHLETALAGTASYDFRWGIGWRPSEQEKVPGASEERRRNAFKSWVDRWTNLSYEGPPPDVDPERNLNEPLVFELDVPWRPESQVLGDEVLLPALPNADLFQNLLTSETRTFPLWLDGGQYRVSLTWSLPAGAVAAQVPEPASGTGPGGLSFRLLVTPEDASHPQASPKVTTTLDVGVPYMLPASEYAGVKRFYQDLQRAAGARLLVKLAAAP